MGLECCSFSSAKHKQADEKSSTTPSFIGVHTALSSIYECVKMSYDIYNFNCEEPT